MHVLLLFLECDQVSIVSLAFEISFMTTDFLVAVGVPTIAFQSGTSVRVSTKLAKFSKIIRVSVQPPNGFQSDCCVPM